MAHTARSDAGRRGDLLGVVGAIAVTRQGNPSLVPVVVAGVGMFTLGIVDDFLQLQPSTKLAGQIAVACTVMVMGHSPAGPDPKL